MLQKRPINNFLYLVLISALFARCEVADKGSNKTNVKTISGELSGVFTDDIYTYKGIPYAQAERFMPPAPPAQWIGVKEALDYGPACPQLKQSMTGISAEILPGESEDCQTLNVWTPEINGNGKRPVIVWLHGGGYRTGSSFEQPCYDGENLARKGDMVVVSVTHRLNVLGFLNLAEYGDKYSASGNVGLLDIVEALRWVNRNIQNFGGDPDNVTIFGQSGGGGKVTNLMAMPDAVPLFHKAIVESGSLNTSMAPRYSGLIADSVLNRLNISPENIDEIQNVPFEELLMAGEAVIPKIKKIAAQEGFVIYQFGWCPTVDGTIIPEQPFDGRAPEISKNIPMIIGTAQNEFNSFYSQAKDTTLESVREVLVKSYGDRTDEYIKDFAKAYPDYKPMDLIQQDLIFRTAAVDEGLWKAEQAEEGGAPVYMYMFNWESKNNPLRAFHCLELPFVFYNTDMDTSLVMGPFNVDIDDSEKTQQLAENMSQAWINFARTGDPNVPGKLPEWDPYTPEKGATMIFDGIVKWCIITTNSSWIL
ncbi:carboxylesterase/lipase family protein [Draconibacterium mangrovi]|uniref:carboxylesterase/lipase family protein n=1 Tax=Draconibacterium mangrovi TaxID=2697469 RepID=UPI0013D5DAB6|nr:carboxylesterase/lipase family protein [Draconibacterium mangrovi]